jgi:hypothetical protein
MRSTPKVAKHLMAAISTKKEQDNWNPIRFGGRKGQSGLNSECAAAVYGCWLQWHTITKQDTKSICLTSEFSVSLLFPAFLLPAISKAATTILWNTQPYILCCLPNKECHIAYPFCVGRFQFCSRLNETRLKPKEICKQKKFVTSESELTPCQ